MNDRIAISRSVGEHNGLVQRIEESGEFLVPKPNLATGFRVGHIDVRNPKPGHPEWVGRPLPVGYIHYGAISLVNTDEPALREYQDRLKAIITGEQ